MGVGAAIVGSAIVGGAVAANSASKARKAQGKASDAAIAEQQGARADFNARTQPFVDTGTAGSQALQSFLGFNENPEFASINSDIDAQLAELNKQKLDLKAALGGKASPGNFIRNAKAQEAEFQSKIQALEEQRTQRLSGVEQFIQGNSLDDPLQKNVTEANQQLQDFISDPSQQLAEINPIVDFLRQQGFEQVQESAAARGRLGAGGTLKDLTRFDANLNSTIVPQLQAQRFDELTSNVQTQGSLRNDRFNQLFNVTGLGANAAAGQGSASLQTANNVGNLLGNRGQAQAQGAINQSNAITGTLNNLAGAAGAFPGVFNSSPAATPPPSTPQATPTQISNALTGAF